MHLCHIKREPNSNISHRLIVQVVENQVALEFHDSPEASVALCAAEGFAFVQVTHFSLLKLGPPYFKRHGGSCLLLVKSTRCPVTTSVNHLQLRDVQTDKQNI